MPSNSAAYMREYRARKKATHEDYDAAKPTIGRIKTECVERIAELEAEVRHLKAELAKAHREVELSHRDLREIGELNETPGVSVAAVIAPAERFNTRPFTPVPKTRK